MLVPKMFPFLFLKDLAISLLHQPIKSFFLLVLITAISLKWIYNRNQINQKRLPPSPPKFPVIGNLHQLGSRPHRSLQSLAQKYGPMMLLHLGSKPLLVVSSADAAREVLKTHDIAFANRPKNKFAGRLLYNHRDLTFLPYGEYWRQVRSIYMLQILSSKRVHSFRTVIEEEVGLMLEKVRQGCSSSLVLDFDEIFSALPNDIVCRIAFGKKYSAEEGGSKFKRLFDDVLHLIGIFNIGDYIPSLEWINHLNGLEAKVKRTAKDFDEYLGLIIEEEIKRLKNGEIGNGKETEQNFIEVLLQVQRDKTSGLSIDLTIMKATILDMILGGSDTTYSLLLWVMSELVLHPNIMKTLQKEVRDTVGNQPAITEEHLAKMHYLKAVIKETLRLHTPVPLLVPHEARQNVKMMGYDIFEGTQVIVNFWAIGRDPSLWEDAEEFKPERFLNDASFDFKGQNFKYIPFGSGRRSCPGTSLANAIAELALASLVYHFEFALPDGVELKDIDMTETISIVIHKQQPLRVVATQYQA